MSTITSARVARSRWITRCSCAKSARRRLSCTQIGMRFHLLWPHPGTRRSWCREVFASRSFITVPHIVSRHADQIKGVRRSIAPSTVPGGSGFSPACTRAAGSVDGACCVVWTIIRRVKASGILMLHVACSAGEGERHAPYGLRSRQN
jgi:hypothetical protein